MEKTSAGFDNTFEFLKKQCKESGQGFTEAGPLRPFAGPVGDVESFTEEDLLKMFDRKDLEDAYEKAAQSDETTNMHADMMVPSIKNDYVAGVHRDTFLRHTNRISRFIAETSRRSNHAENVHEKRKAGMGKFESIKSDAEPA